MEFFVQNWYIVVALLALLIALVVTVARWLALPTEEQLENVRAWLLWAVFEAEKELGGGTGQLKLRSVYDLFVLRFPRMAAIIPFAVFSEMVDNALDNLKELLEKNDAARSLLEGGDLHD